MTSRAIKNDNNIKNINSVIVHSKIRTDGLKNVATGALRCLYDVSIDVRFTAHWFVILFSLKVRGGNDFPRGKRRKKSKIIYLFVSNIKTRANRKESRKFARDHETTDLACDVTVGMAIWALWTPFLPPSG